MSHLREYQTIEDYNNDKTIVLPNVSYIITTGEIIYLPYKEPENIYDYISEDNTIILSDPDLQSGEYTLIYEDQNNNPLDSFSYIGKIYIN